jgi:hypothetical protein
MVYAVVYAENGDVVATYDSQAEAVRDLKEFVAGNPRLQDEMGLRPYENGVPAGDFKSASDVLGDKLAQRHLV